MIAEQGHLIGNHTWRHVQVTSLPKEEAEEEILAVSSLVEELTGNGTSYVRPPFGIWDPELEEELDMIPVLWTIDTLDWTTQNVDWIVEKTVQDAGENDIILMHDSYESTVQAAERIIRRLKAERFARQKENAYNEIYTEENISMDLFDYMRSNTMKSEAPLASRMRPTTLDEIVGQQHIIGKDKLLYRAIRADKLRSVIFYGPPGTGKTTIAKVIAHTTSAEFTQINATVAGKKDMEEVVRQAKDNLGMYGKRTILFVDEIHRFNKGQQDYLLPFVEDGTLILIGATTENPYFEVNGALISRSIIFELKALEKDDIKALLTRALTDMEKGMGAYEAVADGAGNSHDRAQCGR